MKGPFSLDIDDVISDFTRGFFKRFGCPTGKIEEAWKVPRDYWYSWLIPQVGTPEESFNQAFEMIKHDESFWLSLPAIESVIPRSVEIYITSRECPTEITKRWLLKNNFPNLPLYNTHIENRSKAEIADGHGMMGHIDDKSETFNDCISFGLAKSFLVSRPWNIEVETPRRIYRLEELEWRL